MDQIFVKPGVINGMPGSFRHPSNPFRPVPPEGAFVPFDSFTRKRLREGGIVKADPPSESAPIEAPAPALAVRKAKHGDRPADGTGE